MNNLAALLTGLGELDRAFALIEKSLEEARRLGHVVAIAWGEAQLLDWLYWRGEWDELLERADPKLADSAGHGLNTIDVQILRARVNLGRAEPAKARKDSARALELAEQQGDPQVRFPAFATHASVLLASGEEAEAQALVEELLSAWRRNPSSPAGPWIVELAAVLDALGQGDKLRPAAEHPRWQTPWSEGALALVEGDAAGAATIYGRLGAHADAAVTRLRAAEQLISAGERARAEEQLGLALEFFRAAGAERYIREAEALLAVS